MNELGGVQRVKWFVILCTATVAVTADLTMLFQAMRAVMRVGGTCGDGGAYVIETACPDGIGVVFGFGFPGLFILGILMFIAADRLLVPQIVLLIWPALFLSMGYNFLQDGLGSSGDSGYLICGIFFVILGGVPLIFALSQMRKWIGNRPSARHPDLRAVALLERMEQVREQPGSRQVREWQADQRRSGDRALDGLGLTADLGRLAGLLETGALTTEEFRAATNAVLRRGGIQ